MTIALSVKVNDGIVLATDSATTLMAREADGRTLAVERVYNHADKVFNLYRRQPIGMMTWGAGSIGFSSISTLAKDLRKRLSGTHPESNDWMIDEDSLTVKVVADLVHRFFFEERYDQEFATWDEKPDFGLLVAGYSSGESLPESYLLDSSEGSGRPQLLAGRDVFGLNAFGQPEAVFRLLSGFDMPLMLRVLREKLGLDEDAIVEVFQYISENSQNQLVTAPMPIQDAIDLAEFLVQLTVNYSRFTPGPPTVGGPIEVAAITKHEGYKWIRRKHYFPRELNPDLPA